MKVNRTKRLEVRLTEQEYEKISAYAKKRKIVIGELVRRLLLNYIERDEDETFR